MIHDTILELLDFITKSPSAFHAAHNVSLILEQHGFTRLDECETWVLKKGGRYFVERNGSALIAFAVPEHAVPGTGFMLTASHSDSPVFKVKENPEMQHAGCITLNVEKYGGMLIAPWFDRPLSVAGRIVIRGKEPFSTVTKLVHIDRDLLLIPNLAIHMNREANDGWKIDVQSEISPVLSLSESATLSSLVAEEAGVPEEEILSADLYVYSRSAGSRWGAEREFISSPRLDDLECVWTTLEGFLSALEPDSQAENRLSQETGRIPVYCLFDNEEVGSSSRQGADSTFLSETLERISDKIGGSGESYRIALSKSLMVSADNAHAVHPNYASVADPVNRPLINGGIVIKYNASQKYTTDAETSAFFKLVCEAAGVPYQVFTNNANIAGGSTLGNISQNHVSIPCVDIGLAQWAMHSPYETAGVKDVEYMIKAIRSLYTL
ncbi:MAG: M18 family aminopeptidase [Treponema sp.]|nr:M18 family aminopeptidase [Treponema sp.]